MIGGMLRSVARILLDLGHETGEEGGVEAFAALLDALLFTPSRNGKLRLMKEYFATRPDPERGWALAALSGELGVRCGQAGAGARPRRRPRRPGAARLVL